MKKTINFLIIALISCFISYAQETGSIEGKIISKDGYPLSGVTIKLGKKTSVSKTDENGLFFFKNFPVGLHTITIEAEGLKKQTQDIKVIANETTKVTFTLEEQMETLREIVIVIKESPNKRKVSAVRSGLKPLDIPQSMQTIDNEIIAQQQAIRLSEVIKNANGVYVGSARGGAQESFWSRGYDMSANNMFKNGFRYNSGSIPEVSSLDKVEFLKGGSALLYGNVAPGGIINLVTKTPSFKKGGEIIMQTGSYAFYKPSIDFYGPLSKSIAYRLNASYENSESFREVVKRERYYINPSFLLNISSKTQLTLQGDFMNDNWTPDFGTILIGKQIFEVPRGNYYGALWSNGNTKTASASALLNHSLNKNWKLNFNSSYQNYDREWKGTERIQITNPNGTWSRPLGQYKNLEAILGEQISLQGCFKTGNIKHQTFSGIDYENSVATAHTFVFSPSNYDTINVFTFDPNNQTNTEPNAVNTQKVITTTNRFGIYAQDLISFTQKFKMLAGIRWSWQETQTATHNFLASPVTISKGIKLKDKAFSPKIGFIYQPDKNAAIFASYSNSFTPNTGTTADLKPIEASIIDQYEVGIKKDFWNGILSTNITVYQITNSNLAQTAEFKADGVTPNTDTNIKVLNGETTSKGFEIDITAKPIEGLNINAGYSYNDSRFSKTNIVNGGFIEGDRLTRTPANTANLSFFYNIPSGKFKGISLGAIGNYIGNRLGGWNDQYVVNTTTGAVTINDRDIPLQGYTTIDISAGYTYKKWSFLCKLSNITNELNYTVHENYSVNPIAPRQIMTSLKYKF
ncbi:TonB-dependent receptor [Flavobacterium branchiophilum]|uniref:TonB-dependent siderophore receptor n=1 Tax=Flavobacterium branchiophilum TaxID=55197 RepID=A0A2H3KLW2_9FLAO|nr:TonB-dependent receptor [Flavobacterium branchiophilum]PDS24228.1 TonB-dependent siderophore receptor [Flavobacterium branchiophilum]